VHNLYLLLIIDKFHIALLLYDDLDNVGKDLEGTSLAFSYFRIEILFGYSDPQLDDLFYQRKEPLSLQ
jgi:hypothetical protein